MSVNWVSIGSDNGLSPSWHQAIIRTNVGLLLTGTLQTYFSEIWIKTQHFHWIVVPLLATKVTCFISSIPHCQHAVYVSPYYMIYILIKCIYGLITEQSLENNINGIMLLYVVHVACSMGLAHIFQTAHYIIHMKYIYPDSKVHGGNMGPIWGQQDPGGPHVGPMNIAI